MQTPPTDHRLPLYRQLVAYARRHPSRRAAAEQIMRFVCSTPDCFERSHAAGHITGSAWLLNPAGDKALLTLHRKLGRWLQPGGHADGDSDTRRVALREAEEESGIAGIRLLSPGIFDVDVHEIPPSGDAPAHLHYDIRYLLQAPHEQWVLSSESTALAWYTPAQICALQPAADASVLRMALAAPQINATS